jgi:YVTN family beta-propeller protein
MLLTTSLLVLSAFGVYAQADKTAAGQPQKITREGLAFEFSSEPLGPGKAEQKNVLEGQPASIRFKITDAATGNPVTGLHPSAWIDQREPGVADEAKRCSEKVRSFLQATLSKRADVDLNSYFILSLNQEPNISVIDPLSGFGASKLLTLVALKSPGEDWTMNGDQSRLFVSMPAAGQLAVIDTATWRVTDNIEVRGQPARIRLQHDEKYLWIADDTNTAKSGVTVVDTSSLKVAAYIPTGPGPHHITISDDDRYVFVTNSNGTLSVIDVATLVKVKEIKTGSLPSGIAFSRLSNAVYVLNEGDGALVVISARSLEVTARIVGKPGSRAISITPDGRLGFVLNQAENLVYIFDTSNNRLLHTVRAGTSPDQVAFTRNFAYVRSLGEEFVTMIRLANLDKESIEPSVTRFPGGQKAPRLSPSMSQASSIVRAPEEGAVLLANPADQTIYYYTEGMAAPMGSFQNYRRDPRALLVLDKSLSETSPGVYSTTTELARAGEYDVAFFLDSPRVLHCFNLSVGANPEFRQKSEIAIRVEPLANAKTGRLQENYRLRFRVIDNRSNQPKVGLTDMIVMVVLNPGDWQESQAARSVGAGVYEISFVPPQAGVYYVFFQCPSLAVRSSQIPFLVLRVT